MGDYPATWRVRRGEATVYLFGGAPGGAEPWEPDAIAEFLRRCSSFWNEMPDAGPETQALAIQYGFVPGEPLATRIDETTVRRAHAAAASLGVPEHVLAAVRPWLACQLLQSAIKERDETPPAYGSDAALVKMARAMNIPVHHEFPTLEAAMAAFAGLPPAAEAEYLQLYLDEIEAGPDAATERHNQWRTGDLTLAEADAVRVSSAYPLLYEHLIAVRNRAWIPRIREMLATGGTTFVTPGLGHLVGPENVRELLEQCGHDVERV